jgi:hypothetical protein
MVSAKKKKHVSSEEDDLLQPQPKEMAYEQLYLQQLNGKHKKLYMPTQMQSVMKPQEPFRMTTPYKVQTGLYGYQPQLASFASSKALEEQEQYKTKQEQLQQDFSKQTDLEKVEGQLPTATMFVAQPAAAATWKGGVKTVKYTGSKLSDLAETASKWVKGSSQAAATASKEAGTSGAAEAVASQAGEATTDTVIDTAATAMGSEGATAAAPAAGATVVEEGAAAATAVAESLSLLPLLEIGAPIALAVGLGIWIYFAAKKKKKKQQQQQQAVKDLDAEKNAPRPLVHEPTPKEQEQATQNALGSR